MRSGTGRHRRPRQAPAFVVAAGVAGAGFALPLVGSGTASAVSDAAWDRAAECETGGRWSANTGSGYYGGLGLTLRQWREYGGVEFAARPDLASRAQQIMVGERVLADQGHDGFPGCALLSGLWEEYREEARSGSGLVGDVGGVVDSVLPGESGESGGSHEMPEEDEAGETQQTQQTREAQESADAARVDQSVEAPAADGSDGVMERTREGDGVEWGPSPPSRVGRHRGQPDPGEAGAEADRVGERAGGRHADRSGREWRADRGGVRSVDRVVGERAVDGGVYEVRRGDTLWAIAADLGLEGGWSALYAMNKSVIGDDPDHILPGQRLDAGVTRR